MYRKKIASAIAVGVALVTPLIGLAQTPVTPTGPTSVREVVALFAKALGVIQVVFFIVAAIFIIIAAFKYLTAQGDPEKAGEARQMLIYAIIAIAVALLTFVIDEIIGNFLGTGAGPQVTPGTF